MEVNKKIKIAVDVMGGDSAPYSEIAGSILALQESKNSNLEIILVGNKQKVEAILAEKNISNDISKNNDEIYGNISTVDAQEVVTMLDDPVIASKTKKNSSMVKGIQLLKDNLVDGYVSAGNTGATLTIATMILGRIDGVSRPTIGVFLPTVKNKPVFLADVGATVECRARFLYEYAVMGSIFTKAIYDIENPSVGLLNIGEENSKGTNEHIEANKNMKASNNLNFYGNVEGNDILLGKTDVVVTDGFSGNILLKLAEGFRTMIKLSLENFGANSKENKAKTEIAIPIFNELLSGFNYEEYGGVLLLGVKGTVIIGHGSSTPTAIKNMIFSAVSAIEKDVCNKIEIALKK